MRIGSSQIGFDLLARNSLAQAISRLAETGLRLSTLQRINHGSDDPAGLIAAETLRSELTSIGEAATNAARARGTVHVADAGLGEVSNLIHSIRGNVLAISGGGLSDAEKAARQIEINAALDAINRIGRTTSLGGRRLLDGSSSIKVSGVDSDQITDIEVYQNAAGGQQTPEIEVTQAATAATLTFSDADAKLDGDVTLRVTGDEGTVTLEFSAGATLDQVAAAVNAATENTGVSAAVDGGNLAFSSVAVGSEASVAVSALEGTFDVGSGTAEGTDVVVNVDGVEFAGQGGKVEVHTSTLQADIEFAPGFSGVVDPITISGQGNEFVFSLDLSQTSTLVLPNVSTSALGGASGRLSDLATGGSANAQTGDVGKALDILDEAQGQVLDARARAGAFERYTIDSSERVLASMQEEISSAFSAVFDADVAMESSRLIQSQILVQSAMFSMVLARQNRGMIGGLLSP